MIRFLDTQFLFGIVASSLYLLGIHFIQSGRVLIILLFLLRLVIPEVVLFDFGKLILMLLLVVLDDLLISLLVFNQLILIILLRLQLLL